MPRKNQPLKSKSEKFISQIISVLENEFGEVSSPLRYQKEYQFVVSVILSAQCTDERVNQVTPKLFAKYPTLQSLSEAVSSELQEIIFPTGFYKNKSQHILGFAERLIKQYNGIIPRTMEELLSFPGIGRKTANVILSELYGLAEGFVVDTHVKRVAFRLGLTENKNPNLIEKDLMEIVPRKNWNSFSLHLIFHGRKTCKARNPLCEDCNLRNNCLKYTTESLVALNV